MKNARSKTRVLLATVLMLPMAATAGPGAPHAHDEYAKEQGGHMMSGHHEQMMSEGSHHGDSHHGNNHHGNSHHGNSHHGNSHHGNSHHGNSHHGNNHHGGHHGDGHHMDTLAGQPGKESDVDREIKVVANDQMRFVHEPIQVREGETIRFVITNEGKITHEFAIGTKEEHQEHGEMMKQHPGMHHGPGGSAITIQPGDTVELLWRFEEAWQVEAACNIPGHYAAGMHSPVVFVE